MAGTRPKIPVETKLNELMVEVFKLVPDHRKLIAEEKQSSKKNKKEQEPEKSDKSIKCGDPLPDSSVYKFKFKTHADIDKEYSGHAACALYACLVIVKEKKLLEQASISLEAARILSHLRSLDKIFHLDGSKHKHSWIPRVVDKNSYELVQLKVKFAREIDQIAINESLKKWEKFDKQIKLIITEGTRRCAQYRLLHPTEFAEANTSTAQSDSAASRSGTLTANLGLGITPQPTPADNPIPSPKADVEVSRMPNPVVLEDELRRLTLS